ncbi:hypothetical protein [Nocardioides sp. B-3]|uniref:hypothetical protein n=1 Tax=Nocardioides sp. B-3 TaxID=2895565 RepID=UPI002152BE89|nr:hypothetical protein [Nocardioides sp. B-3]UUZ57769.1 hypothetical protein LP418_15235 [Nocardioides sp. B-3]
MTTDFDPLPVLLGFTRALKAAGVPVTPDRAHGFVEATAIVGLDDQQATYWAGRATLCAGPDDLTRYDPGLRGVVRPARRAAEAPRDRAADAVGAGPPQRRRGSRRSRRPGRR